ncbi:hypothetical protein BDZ94DRAFT_1225790 [Collybia nuda]|uniref:DUF7702 domain-containing protein n=1 Tax=Collybia nuda TaxID=64659 RepID=A0A9P5XZY4_9AGAR|nr:hypothetical protein BDZ94DRAFT_1225790 [Collybia nuda]
MLSLDVKGKIAAAQIAIYVPVVAFTIILVFRYAFRRDGGWLFLFIFSSIRVAGGALLIAGEMIQPSNIDLFISSYVLQGAGLGPLLISTIGFLGLAGQNTYSENTRVSVIFRIYGIIGLAGVGLTTAGGVLGTHVSPDQGHIGLILRRVGAGVFSGLYVLLLLAHIGAWTYRFQMRYYRRKLLWGLTIALPFLGVRVAYGILAAWSSSDLFGVELSPNPTLVKFNPVTGDWIAFLVMSLIMEFVVTTIYLLSSTILSRRHK